jgi:hypothetical protein
MTEKQTGYYWMHETSGVLRPVVMAYLQGKDLTQRQVATMRAYLRQWIKDPMWQGEEIDGLRQQVETIADKTDISVWIHKALEAGIDPL